MMKYRVLIIALLNIALLLVCSKVNDAKAIPQSPLTIENAKSKLEELQRQLFRVDNEAREEIERTIAEQVKTTPKGEFETTKEYEARQARENELGRQIEGRINQKKENHKESLNRQLNELLSEEFNLPIQAKLGAYDADAQRFPFILQENQESLFVPRVQAKEFKENFSLTEKIGIFGLHLDAQNQAKPYLLSGEISYRDKVYRIENREMNVARAMFMLFGNYNSVSNRAKWRFWDETDAEYRPLEAIPVLSRSFREENVTKFILVTGFVPEGQTEFADCHACGAKIGIAVFSQRGSSWKLELGEKDIGSYGSMGVPPQASLVKIGVDRYALAFSTGDMHQGVTDEGVEFIDRVDGVFREILSIQTAYDTSGYGIMHTPEDNEFYNSQIQYIPGSHPRYFDIKVVTRGKRGVKVGTTMIMRPFVKLEIYKFSEGVYKRAPSP
jgi:hypothetical protein